MGEDVQKILVRRAGGYDALEYVASERVALGPREVRLAVAAIGVNFADCFVRMGLYESAKVYVGWPITPGFEVAGTVVEIGSEVRDLAVGTRVIGLTRFGAYTSELVTARELVFEPPASWSIEEAAGFSSVALTAWYALCHLAHARAGETVLVHSAAGGVGLIAVQIARVLGCRVIGVVRGSHKVEEAQKAGCDLVIDKGNEDIWSAVKTFAPNGVEVILDANGVETLGEGYRHLAATGRLVIYGFATMLVRGGNGRPSWPKLIWSWLRTPRFNPLDLTTSNRSILAFNLSFLFEKNEILREALDWLLPLAEAGKILPLPYKTWPLAHAGEAHRAIETGTTVGKLILLP